MSCLTCSEFDGLLFEQTSEPHDADERLREHAASCSRCAAVWKDERALDAAIAAWKTGVPEADLTERVLARWRDEREAVPSSQPQTGPRRERSPARGNQHFALLALASAAALVLAFSLVSQDPLRSTPDFATAHPEVKTGSGAATNRQPSPRQDADELPVAELVAGIQTRYSGAARRMTGIVDKWKFEWPAVAEVDVDLLPQGKPATAPKPGPRHTGNRFEATLKPIGRDVGQAFGFLRDAIPGLDGSST